MRRKSRWIWLSVALALVMPGCSDDDGGSGPATDVEAPTVTAFSLPDSAAGVGLVTPVTVTFSEPMDPKTITPGAISLASRPGRGQVRYAAATHAAVFVPDTIYAPGDWQRLVVGGATDVSGNPVGPAALDFRAGTLDCEHLADGFEPNEDIASAAAVAIGETYPCLTACEDEMDTYFFTLTQAAKVTIRTPVRHAMEVSPGDYNGWQINFMNAEREYYGTLGTGADPSSPPSYYYSFLPGTYYFEVGALELQSNEFVLYDLETTAVAPCADDRYEDNDFPSEAAEIATGLHADLKGCHVDNDCYRVAVLAGDTLAVSVDAAFPAGAWTHRRMSISGAGMYVSQDSEEVNPYRLEAVAASDGQAVLEVRFWVDGVTYSMDVEIRR